MERTFKIKSKYKAAFINAIEEKGVKVASNNIKNDLVDDTFIVKTEDPEEIRAIQAFLKSSTKIRNIKEMVSKIIKEEVRKRLAM